GQFSFTGKMDYPDLRVIAFNKSPEQSFPIYLDNSEISISAQQGALDKVQIKGSPAHEDFVRFNSSTQAFQHLFTGNGGDPEEMKKAAGIMESYARNYRNSFI